MTRAPTTLQITLQAAAAPAETNKRYAGAVLVVATLVPLALAMARTHVMHNHALGMLMTAASGIMDADRVPRP